MTTLEVLQSRWRWVLARGHGACRIRVILTVREALKNAGVFCGQVVANNAGRTSE